MKQFIQTTFLLFILLSNIHVVFSQVSISPEKLLGDWKVIGGEGEHFDKETIGSVFHFNQSGKFVADLTEADNQQPTQKKGTWKVSGNFIIIASNSEEEMKPLALPVTKFENDLLYILDEKSNIILFFERIKN